jgi:hypothetical protein
MNKSLWKIEQMSIMFKQTKVSQLNEVSSCHGWNEYNKTHKIIWRCNQYVMVKH